MGKRRRNSYHTRVLPPPLSDERTPSVCAHCGKQHPPSSDWNDGVGCHAQGAVFRAPQKDAFIRASGECVCAACGKQYWQHPRSENPAFMTTDALGHEYSWVHVLCDGTAVKL